MEKTNEKKISLKSAIKYLLKSVREYKKSSILSIIFIALETAFECVIPLVMMYLLNFLTDYETGKNPDPFGIGNFLYTTLLFAAILIVLALLSFGCGVTAGKVSAKAACGFAKNLREDVFNKTTEFSFKNIDKFSSSSLITRQTTDINNIQMAYMISIRIAFRAPIMFIFAFVMFLVIDAKLSWIFLILIPLIAVPLILIVWQANKRFEKLFKLYDGLNEKVEEDIRGMRVVKTYAREDFEKKKFEDESYTMSKGFRVVEQMLSGTNPIIQCVMYCSMCLILFLGSLAVIETKATELNIGGISSLITYSSQVLSSIMMLTMVSFFILMAVPGFKRVYEVLIEEPSIKNPSNPVLEVKNGDIEFKDVSFKYNENAQKFALSNVNLTIKEGEMIGIIGSTGSSKSTLVNLISRFYDVSEGELLVGGVNVKNYDLKVLRDNVAMVLQKNVLFAGSIADNLRWGKKDASIDEIKKACHIAQADSFVEAFDDQYDHHIEQGGTNVSGGQRQRLCIARALLKNPKVLILDDSTSAVDTKTDAYIRSGLRKYCPGVTKIIIAQRISSVSDADKIIVMDNGTISGVGTHEELLKTNKIYQEVYELQNRIGGK